MNEYIIFTKSKQGCFNINMRMFICMAHSKEEAIGKMVLRRKDLNPYDIKNIRENNFVDDGYRVVYSSN